MDVDGVGDYSKLAIRQYPARALRETAEGKYWKRFHAPLLAKQFGAVSSIDFCESAPHHLAVTASTRVTLYDGQTRQVRREIQRFSDKAYSGRFRQDGKLLAAGGEDGVVKVFDTGSRTMLRQLKAHRGPVQVVRYGPDRLHLLSGGDDTTVRWWDVAAGEQLARLDGHSDYVRAAACSAASPDTWATGGYDHMCKLWDLRSGSAVAELDHGAPIEDVVFFPTGSMVATAGGTAICVWDVLAGGRPLKRLSNHQKTVASIVLAGWTGPAAASGPRLLSGALDGHVKVYELDSFRVTHAQKYAAPVLSLGLSPDCSLLAVGMADGTLSIRKHAHQQTRPAAAGAADSATAPPRRQARPLTATSYRYFLRGQSEKAAAGEFVLAQRRRAKLKPYDRLLRKFLYRKALDAALATRRADVVASVLEELSARGGLQTALGGRDAESLLPLLSHLCRYIGDTRHCRSLCSVAHAVLDLYSSVVGESPDVDAKLAELLQQVTVELQAQEQLLVVQGCLEPVLAASLRATSAAEPN